METIADNELHLILSPALTEDPKLHRFISFRQFMSFVELRQTSLSRVKAWPDTWEVPAARLPIQTDDGPVQFSLWNINESMFGQCWSLYGESDAMWRIYSPQNEGVVIQTSVKKFRLLRDIKYAALGPVIYYDDLKTVLDEVETHPRRGPYERFTGAFLKRKAFEHEKEVRLVTMDDQQCLGRTPPDKASRLSVDLVDPDYDAFGDVRKRSPIPSRKKSKNLLGHLVTPDIVVHHPLHPLENLLAIEAKPEDDKRGTTADREKLRSYQGPPLYYPYVAVLILGATKTPLCRYELFHAGENPQTAKPATTLVAPEFTG
jgi:hypothetical protein